MVVELCRSLCHFLGIFGVSLPDCDFYFSHTSMHFVEKVIVSYTHFCVTVLHTCSAVTVAPSAVDDATFLTPSALRFLMGNNLFGHPAWNGGCKTMMVTAELVTHHRAIKTVKYECSICGTIKLRGGDGLDLFFRIRTDVEWGWVKNVAVAL